MAGGGDGGLGLRSVGGADGDALGEFPVIEKVN